MEKLKDEDFLITNLGFKRVDNDDFSGHWLAKAIEHPYLVNLEVVIDEIHGNQVIILNAKDFDSVDATGAFYMGDYSLLDLKEILYWLEI